MIRLALVAACVAVLAASAQPKVPHADVAEAAEAVVAGTNALRQGERLPALRVEPRLARAAREFAAYMAKTTSYGHEADGRDPPARARAHGYDYCLVLENIAYHYDSRGFGTARLAHDIVEGWKASPPHRANLLNAIVTHVGVGIARSDRNGHYYTVQVLGLPRSASVKFEVRNESRREVRYRVGDEAYTVPARSLRTHEACGREALRFERPAGTFQPRSGDRFVITPEGDAVAPGR